MVVKVCTCFGTCWVQAIVLGERWEGCVCVCVCDWSIDRSGSPKFSKRAEWNGHKPLLYPAHSITEWLVPSTFRNRMACTHNIPQQNGFHALHNGASGFWNKLVRSGVWQVGRTNQKNPLFSERGELDYFFTEFFFFLWQNPPPPLPSWTWALFMKAT
jgi:hypothetical protein